MGFISLLAHCALWMKLFNKMLAAGDMHDSTMISMQSLTRQSSYRGKRPYCTRPVGELGAGSPWPRCDRRRKGTKGGSARSDQGVRAREHHAGSTSEPACG
jgi:hypothetical protein